MSSCVLSRSASPRSVGEKPEPSQTCARNGQRFAGVLPMLGSPEVIVIRSRIVIWRSIGSVTLSCSGTPRTCCEALSGAATWRPSNSGSQLVIGWSTKNRPSSCSCMVSAATTGLVWEYMRNSESSCSGVRRSMSRWPCTPQCATCPWRSTTVTTPGTSPRSTAPATVASIRASRAESNPTSSGVATGRPANSDIRHLLLTRAGG